MNKTVLTEQGGDGRLVDAHDSKSCILTGVPVRFRLEPPKSLKTYIFSKHENLSIRSDLALQRSGRVGLGCDWGLRARIDIAT
jgi:hypothetical protein